MAQANKEIENKNVGAGRSQSEKSSQNLGENLNVDTLAHDVTTKLGSMAEEVSNRASDYVSNTRNYVKDHPLQSIAIAAASGLAVGSIITLVSKRKH